MRIVTGFIFAWVLALSVPSLVQAQTQSPEIRRDPAPAAVDRRDDNFDWGWLGLLGLGAGWPLGPEAARHG